MASQRARIRAFTTVLWALVVKYSPTIRVRLSGELCIFSGDFPVGGLYLDQIVADCVVDQFDDGVNL
jgi:hypothetical protein